MHVYKWACVCRSVCACVHRSMSSIPGRSESLGSRDCQSLGDPYIPLQFSTAARGSPEGDTSTGPCRSGTAWRSSLDDPTVGSPLSLRASSYLGAGLAPMYPALLQRLIPRPLAVLPEYCLGLKTFSFDRRVQTSQRSFWCLGPLSSHHCVRSPLGSWVSCRQYRRPSSLCRPSVLQLPLSSLLSPSHTGGAPQISGNPEGSLGTGKPEAPCAWAFTAQDRCRMWTVRGFCVGAVRVGFSWLGSGLAVWCS